MKVMNTLISKTISLYMIILLLFKTVDSFALPEGYEVRYFNGMRYGLFIPPSYNPDESYPLILYLHGCNDTVSHDLDLYHEPIQGKDPCFVLTPKAVNMIDWCDAWGHSWFPEHTPDMMNTLEIIDLLEEEFSIDTNRRYVYGISMGSFGTFSLLARNAGMFASAFAICGGGNTLTADEVAKTPLWIFHGDADQMVPVERSRSMYYAILNAGGTQVRYTEYPGVDHDAWEPALREPTLYDWFLSHVRGEDHGPPDNAEDFDFRMINNSRIELSWMPPSDHLNPDNQVWYYKIFRDDELIAEIDNIYTTFTDSISASTSVLEYKLSTVNFFFRESVISDPLFISGLSTPAISSGNIPLEINIVPNPVHGIAMINYQLVFPGRVILEIYNLKGELVTVLENDYLHAGIYRIDWNTRSLTSGIYFCRICTDDGMSAVKFVLMNE
jgi:hypothetical protein